MEGSEQTQDAEQPTGKSTFDEGEQRAGDAPVNVNAPVRTSAPPPEAQSGDPLDPATKAGLGLGGQVPNQGEARSVGQSE